MNQPEKARFAPLKNVTALMTLVNRLQARSVDLPGFGVFHGPSGYGKTKAAIYACNKTRAPMVSIGDSWTRRKFLEHVLREIGIANPRGTVADMTERAIEILGEQINRPLIIDEADKAVDKGFIELIREIHDYSQAPIILIGEEQLPGKLMQVERVHNRVLDWQPAQPCDIDDARHLSAVYAPELRIDDALLDRICKQCGGVARRISTTLAEMTEFARTNGVSALDLTNFSGRVHTGQPTKRRAA